MIIAKTPFRLSLFGGGTDYAEFFKNYEDGLVIGLGIDKYSYILLRKLPRFFDFKSRVCYYKIETVEDNEQIEHSAINAILNKSNVDFGVEMFYSADLPARSGIGSSSTFSTCLTHAVKALKGEFVSKDELSNLTLELEHNILKENVGYQDQLFAAYGGFNIIKFTKYGHIIKPVITSKEFTNELEESLVMVYTGIQRNSSEVVGSYLNNFDEKIDDLRKIKRIAEKSLKYIDSYNIKGLGQLLDESWKYKRSLSKNISNPTADRIYEIALSAGAYGGKIMGGGGGGFMMFLIDPSKKDRFKYDMKDYTVIDVKINWTGSEIIYAR